jgi:hypothetical protein
MVTTAPESMAPLPACDTLPDSTASADWAEAGVKGVAAIVTVAALPSRHSVKRATKVDL